MLTGSPCDGDGHHEFGWSGLEGDGNGVDDCHEDGDDDADDGGDRVGFRLENTSPQKLAGTGRAKADWDVKEPEKQSENWNYSEKRKNETEMIENKDCDVEAKNLPILSTAPGAGSQ